MLSSKSSLCSLSGCTVAQVFVAVILGVQSPIAETKAAQGILNTRTSALSIGQPITDFCFTAGNSRLFYRMNASAQGQIYLYKDHIWTKAALVDDCNQKVGMAQHRVDLLEKEGNFTLLQIQERGQWVAVYAPENMCNRDNNLTPAVYLQYNVQLFNEDSHGSTSNQFSCEDSGNMCSRDNSLTPAVYLQYNVQLFNEDSHRSTSNQFSCEGLGLLFFYEVLALLYFVIGCVCAPSLHETLQKQGPMHDVLSMLTKVLCLQAFAALCMFIHLYQYSRDGEGSLLAENLAEVLEICAQFGMLYMMLSLALGWTLSTSKTEVNSKIWKTSPHAKVVGSLAACQCICIILEQLFSSSHSLYHDHQSFLGILALLLRTVLAVLFAHYLYQVVSKERSHVRRGFYKNFATYCFIWFMAYPVILALSTLLSGTLQKRAVVFGVTLSQSVAVIKLYRLFLSRSLYWEISSLSSASLPLRLDIKNYDNSKSKK